MKNDTWCVNAFHSLCGMNDGTTKPCCMYNFNDDVSYPVLGVNPISDHMKFPEFVEVREALSSGVQHERCKRCWDEERAGITSKRMIDNRVYREHVENTRKPFKGLAKVELNLGNTCNIKCRTCHPSTSSTWMKEHHDLYVKEQHHQTYKQFTQVYSRFYKHYEEQSPFWEDIENHLDTIKQFDFYGGEPFMSKKMWALIETAYKKGYASDISLQYNSNTTLWPEQGGIEYWKYFKHVNLNFSVDGIEKQFELMRHPAKWDIALENMNKAVSLKNQNGNMHVGWCITLSTLNIFYLPETLKFFYENFEDFGLYLNLVHGPRHYNISIMPESVKQKVQEKLEDFINKFDFKNDRENGKQQIIGVLNFMNNNSSDENEWENFKTAIETHDSYRKEDYYNTFPEFGELIKAK